jgi:hypothetical protein
MNGTGSTALNAGQIVFVFQVRVYQALHEAGLRRGSLENPLPECRLDPGIARRRSRGVLLAQCVG